MNQKIIYIAGPMRGYEDYNSKAFVKSTVKGRNKVNFLLFPICLAMVRECDAVIMLDGYQSSSGSMVEYSFAIQCHIPVFTSTAELQNFFDC